MVYDFLRIFYRFVVAGAVSERKASAVVLHSCGYGSRVFSADWSKVLYEQDAGIHALLFGWILFSKALDGKTDGLENTGGMEADRRSRCGAGQRALGGPVSADKGVASVLDGTFSCVGKRWIRRDGAVHTAGLSLAGRLLVGFLIIG